SSTTSSTSPGSTTTSTSSTTSSTVPRPTTTTSSSVPATSSTSSTVPTTTLPPVCPAPGGVVCDDGDPCTVDTCVAGVCDNSDKLGLDGVTCTCERPTPEVCANQTIPHRVQRSLTRA